VLYDLRVAYLHLTSTASSTDKMETITDRLTLPRGAPFFDVYDALVEQLTRSYRQLVGLM
jgi:hypothetical protein